MKDKPAVVTVKNIMDLLGPITKEDVIEMFKAECDRTESLINRIKELENNLKIKELKIEKLESLLESKANYVCNEHLVKRIKELEEENKKLDDGCSELKFEIVANMIAYGEEMLKKDKEIERLRREREEKCENRESKEAKIKEFMDNMPYHVGSGKSYNEIMLEAIRFGENLTKEE